MNEILNSENEDDKAYVADLFAENEDILNEFLDAGYSYGGGESATVQKKNNG